MDDIHNLDAVADGSTVPTGRQESKASRFPWHKPALRRTDITLSTKEGHLVFSDSLAGYS